MATVKADGVMLEYAILMEVVMEMAVLAAVAALLVETVSRTVIVVVGANKIATASAHANLINEGLSFETASFSIMH